MSKLKGDCLIVNDVSSRRYDAGSPSIESDSFILCGDDAQNFLEEIQEIVDEEEYDDWDIESPTEYAEAFWKVMGKYIDKRIEPKQQSFEWTYEEGRYTRTKMELKGEIEAKYKDEGY
jgi:hypothetical protein